MGVGMRRQTNSEKWKEQVKDRQKDVNHGLHLAVVQTASLHPSYWTQYVEIDFYYIAMPLHSHLSVLTILVILKIRCVYSSACPQGPIKETNGMCMQSEHILCVSFCPLSECQHLLFSNKHKLYLNPSNLG